MNRPAELLEIRGLGKTYQSRGRGSSAQKALEGVDFQLAPGELVSVIGPSGAGKSTFLRCINRLIEPTEGTITFCGEPITHLPRGRLRPVRRQIAMIFQNYNLVYRLTAIQNVLHGRLGYKNALAGSLGIYSEEEKMRAFEILDEVGLGAFAYRRADQLSGGQKQRVGIARALIQDPKIVLCDEPIASLDPKSSHLVMEQLRSLGRQHGIACIVNLHQVEAALEFSDRIIGLHEGHKVFEGTPDEVDQEAIERIYEGSEDTLVTIPLGERQETPDREQTPGEQVPVGTAPVNGDLQ
ncbi:MAG: phosphonate ABC transporter ATP-binding protein [Coriobacteriales bacterium]